MKPDLLLNVDHHDPRDWPVGHLKVLFATEVDMVGKRFMTTTETLTMTVPMGLGTLRHSVTGQFFLLEAVPAFVTHPQLWPEYRYVVKAMATGSVAINSDHREFSVQYPAPRDSTSSPQ